MRRALRFRQKTWGVFIEKNKVRLGTPHVDGRTRKILKNQNEVDNNP